MSRFLLDENVSPTLVTALRAGGHDAAHVNDLALGATEDAVIMLAAARSGRTVITHDHDFVDNLRTLGARAPSVIRLVQSDSRAGDIALVGTAAIASRLAETLPALEPHLRRGAAVTLHRSGLAVHPLPLERPLQRSATAPGHVVTLLERVRERRLMPPDLGRSR